MALIDDIKHRIGYSGNTRNNELNALIEAAQDDLVASGVSREAVNMGSARIDVAITSYVLASVYSDMDINTANHYQDAYRRQASKLALTERCK